MSRLAASPHLGPVPRRARAGRRRRRARRHAHPRRPRPELAKRIVYVSNVSEKDDADDKEIRANCPRGTMLLGGGSAVQHGNESPSVAMYQGYPVDNGWEVQAHLTNPAEDDRFPNWDLFAVAICLRT